MQYVTAVLEESQKSFCGGCKEF